MQAYGAAPESVAFDGLQAQRATTNITTDTSQRMANRVRVNESASAHHRSDRHFCRNSSALFLQYQSTQ
jgi:hypothetical protein